MISHYPAKLGGHWHCSSRDMFLVVEEENSTCTWDAILSHMNFQNVDIAVCLVCPRSTSRTGKTYLQQQLMEHNQKTCASTSKRCREKEREANKKKGICNAFYVTCNREKRNYDIFWWTFYKICIEIRFKSTLNQTKFLASKWYAFITYKFYFG